MIKLTRTNLQGKRGWREVVIGPADDERRCLVVALDTWLRFARIAHGPLFRRVTGAGKRVGTDRLSPKHVDRLVKATAATAGVGSAWLTEKERNEKFSAHSLRAGLATSVPAVLDAKVQQQLGHANPQMTERYKHRRKR
jgi:integrase